MTHVERAPFASSAPNEPLPFSLATCFFFFFEAVQGWLVEYADVSPGRVIPQGFFANGRSATVQYAES